MILALAIAVAQSPLDALASDDPAVAARAMDELHRGGDESRRILTDALPTLSGAAADRARAVLDLLDWAQPAPRITLRLHAAMPATIAEELSRAAGVPVRYRASRWSSPEPVDLDVADAPLPAALLEIAGRSTLLPCSAPAGWRLVEDQGAPSGPAFAPGPYAVAVGYRGWAWDAPVGRDPRERMSFSILLVPPPEVGQLCGRGTERFEWLEFCEQAGQALPPPPDGAAEPGITDAAEPDAEGVAGWGCGGDWVTGTMWHEWALRADTTRVSARGWMTVTTRSEIRSIDLALGTEERPAREGFEVVWLESEEGYPKVHLLVPGAEGAHYHLALGDREGTFAWPAVLRVGDDRLYHASFHDVGVPAVLRVYEMGPAVERRFYMEFRDVDVPR